MRTLEKCSSYGKQLDTKASESSCYQTWFEAFAGWANSCAVFWIPGTTHEEKCPCKCWCSFYDGIAVTLCSHHFSCTFYMHTHTHTHEGPSKLDKQICKHQITYIRPFLNLKKSRLVVVMKTNYLAAAFILASLTASGWSPTASRQRCSCRSSAYRTPHTCMHTLHSGS